jgi:hypothetical protein
VAADPAPRRLDVPAARHDPARGASTTRRPGASSIRARWVLRLSISVCMYVFICLRRRHIASSPAPAAADLGAGVRWRWRAVVVAPALPPLSLWRAGVVAWWHGVVARRRVCGGGVRWGPRRPLHFFYFKIHLRRELIWPLGAHSPRGVPTALGEGCFAGCKPPRGNRREQTLGEGATVGKPSFTERIVALGEASVSGSDF